MRAGVIGLQSFVVGNNCVALWSEPSAGGEATTFVAHLVVLRRGTRCLLNYSFATDVSDAFTLIHGEREKQCGLYTSGGSSSVSGRTNTP